MTLPMVMTTFSFILWTNSSIEVCEEIYCINTLLECDGSDCGGDSKRFAMISEGEKVGRMITPPKLIAATSGLSEKNDDVGDFSHAQVNLFFKLFRRKGPLCGILRLRRDSVHLEEALFGRLRQ